MNNVTQVTDETFREKVLAADKPVIIDFWAPWCGPCVRVSPIVDQLANEYADSVTVAKINVDENPRIAAEYGITSIPAVYLFSQGEVKTSVIGARPKQFYEKAFAEYLGTKN